MTDRQTYSCQGCTRDDLTLTKNGRVRSHAPNGKRVGPDNPACPEGSNFPVQDTEFHTHRFTWGDDDNGHSGSACMVDGCGMAEPEDEPEEAPLPAPPNPFRAPLPGGLHDNANRMGLTSGELSIDLPMVQARTVPNRAPTPEQPTEPPYPRSVGMMDGPADLSSREGFGGRPTKSRPTSADDFLDGGDDDEEYAEDPDEDTRPFWQSRYDGTCYTCGTHFLAGENIRKVDGGYEAEECCGPYARQQDQVEDRPKAVARTLPVERGMYVLPHPRTGKRTRGRRSSKYAEGIADSYALDQWRHRMILVGVARDPEIIDKVQSALRDKDPLDVVKKERDFLHEMADKAMSAAGGDIRSTAGTTSHKYTEEVDGGTRELADVPEEFRPDAAAYVHALNNCGFRPIKGLIERSVYCEELNVSGTFDRVLECVRDTNLLDLNGRMTTIKAGEFVIGDVKTGDNLEHPWLEILIQSAIYAHAVNENGIAVQDEPGGPFRWVSLEECGAGKVREDVGVVMHVPYGQATCKFYATDLITGWRGAQLCHANHEFWKIKMPKVPIAEYSVQPEEVPSTPAERDAAMAKILAGIPELCPGCHHEEHPGTCDVCGCFNGVELDAADAIRAAGMPGVRAGVASEIDYAKGEDIDPDTLLTRPDLPEPPEDEVHKNISAVSGPEWAESVRHEKEQAQETLFQASPGVFSAGKYSGIEKQFRDARTRDEANAAWVAAKKAGVPAETIKWMIGLVKLDDPKAQTAVSEPPAPPRDEPVAETGGSRETAAQDQDGPSLTERAHRVTTKAEASKIFKEINDKIKTMPEEKRPAAREYRDKLVGIMREKLANVPA